MELTADWFGADIFFPPSAFRSLTEDTSLSVWLSLIQLDVDTFVRYNKMDGTILSEKQHCPYYLSDQWKDHQRRGPKNIPLQTVSSDLWKKILSKTSSIAAIRLAKTTSTGATAFDSYVNSVPTVQFMIQTAHLVASDTDDDHMRMEGMVELCLRVRVAQYFLRPLFENSLKSYLWPRRLTEEQKKPFEAIIEEIGKKNKKCSENKWKHECLGHPFIRGYDPCIIGNGVLLHPRLK